MSEEKQTISERLDELQIKIGEIKCSLEAIQADIQAVDQLLAPLVDPTIRKIIDKIQAQESD